VAAAVSMADSSTCRAAAFSRALDYLHYHSSRIHSIQYGADHTVNTNISLNGPHSLSGIMIIETLLAVVGFRGITQATHMLM